MMESLLKMSSETLFSWYSEQYQLNLYCPFSDTKPLLNLFKGGFWLIRCNVVTLSSVFWLVYDIKRMQENYKLARYVMPENGKKNYIVFYCHDFAKNKMIRQRIYCQDKIKAKKIIKDIDEKLVQGFGVNSADTLKSVTGKVIKSSDATNTITFDNAMKEFVKLKKSTTRKSNINNLLTVVKFWTIYLKKSGFDKAPVSLITQSSIQAFIDEIITTKKLSSKTVNNYLGYINVFFNHLVERGFIDKNPATKIKKLKEIAIQHIAYTDSESTLILEELKENKPNLYLFVQFMYYTFIRPNELRQLQIKHIQGDKIVIPGAISKNKKSEFVVIPNDLATIIKEKKLDTENPEFYIFGKDGVPAATILSKNVMTENHKNVVRKLKLAPGHTLYSWKHTGVIKAYQSGLDIKNIQKQCRHYDISETDKYLRSLGLFNNDEIKNNFPTLK